MATRTMLRRVSASDRRGTVTVLAAFFSIAMLGMVAFSVDVGYVLSVKEELQRTADAAAMAAAWEYANGLAKEMPPESCALSGRAAAADTARFNVVGRVNPEVGANYSNSGSGDIVFGHVPDLYSPTALDTSQPGRFNVARVKIRRDETLNGEAPLFFARIFGMQSQSLEAEATAGIVRDVGGFEIPSSGGNIDLLPFALDEATHNDWLAGCGSDDWAWDPESKSYRAGSDGMPEVNLYPQGTGSPGNRGTVDIGGSNNSTKDIARQILHGINAEDLVDLGKPLVFNECGVLELNGDTGISAGVKDELADIRGQTRVIPIFREVNGPGNNAVYKIVAWQGIRIMDVKLTGPMNKKHVTIQMAPVLSRGVIASTTQGASYQVYSPVVLIQ